MSGSNVGTEVAELARVGEAVVEEARRGVAVTVRVEPRVTVMRTMEDILVFAFQIRVSVG